MSAKAYEMGCCALGSWASPLSVPVRIVSDGHALQSIPSAPIAPSWSAEDVGEVHESSEGRSPHGCHVHKDAHVNTRWKWRLVIAYDGTKYAGWQFQRRPATVQYMVEKALSKFTKLARDELCLVGASRTDAGVHAWGQSKQVGEPFQQFFLGGSRLITQGIVAAESTVIEEVAHFVTPFSFDHLESLHAALNGILPPDICVREIAAVRPEFHARYLALKKTYHYKIYNDPIMDPFQHSYAYHCTHKLSIDAMRQAAKHFIGRHDFSAFANRSRDGLQNNLMREIFHFDVVKMGANLQLEVEGSGFFYKQVRSMVGLLLEVGKEALPPDIVLDVLASRDRRRLAKFSVTAPPYGLRLMSVSYTDTDLEPPTGSPPACFGRHHQISKCIVTYY